MADSHCLDLTRITANCHCRAVSVPADETPDEERPRLKDLPYEG